MSFRQEAQSRQKRTDDAAGSCLVKVDKWKSGKQLSRAHVWEADGRTHHLAPRRFTRSRTQHSQLSSHAVQKNKHDASICYSEQLAAVVGLTTTCCWP